ncbi:hypothetical protein [Epilithonimonas caeni]|uniref:hypothetical protein n=1 Tax=Epilithonimonas caeni TaxID=365343 RepID=UPI0004289A36|nr:hypothetical protein [Epilithonimonas caeni]
MKSIVKKEIFNQIVNIQNDKELRHFLIQNNIRGVIFFSDIINENILGIEFTSDLEFEDDEIILDNLYCDITFRDQYFNNIIIKNNIEKKIVFDNVKCKNLNSDSNNSLTLEFIDSQFDNVYIENDNFHRINFTNTSISNTVDLSESSTNFFYVENSNIDTIEIHKCEIDYEGFYIKSSNIKRIHINQQSQISHLDISESTKLDYFSASDSSIKNFEISQSNLISIHFSVLKLYEFRVYNSEVISINLYLSNINRISIDNKCNIDSIIIQNQSNVGLLLVKDNCTIHQLSINKKTNVYLINFYKNVIINYIDSDHECILGDFDIFDSTIKSLQIINQKNSYNIQNSTINLLKLSNCEIHSLNILNGCKIEGYIVKSKINKLEFKQVFILRDTLISFSSCEIYSILMEEFSVIGNLYFRDLRRLAKPLDNWSDINKYTFQSNLLIDADEKFYLNTKKIILEYIKNNIEENKNWIYNSNEIEEITLEKHLVEENYDDFDKPKIIQLIDRLRDAQNINLSGFERFLLRKIRKHNSEKEKTVSYINRIYEIVDFIWNVLSKVKLIDLEFQNINKPIFRVFHSSLGKTEFSNCELNQFEFQYNNSNFLECIFLGTEVPEQNLTILKNDKIIIDYNELDKVNKINYYYQKTDFYNQFKKVYERQGNIYEAGIFNSKWSENQEKLLLLKINQNEDYLNKTNDFNSFIRSVFLFFYGNKEKVMDVFTFNLNRISNGHGEDWIKSLKFILIPTFIIFIFYILSIRYDFSVKYLNCSSGLTFDSDVFNYFFINLKYYFEFLNPARKFDFIKLKDGESLSFWSSLWDIIGRIIVSFGIYQLIVAFRKNAKK